MKRIKLPGQGPLAQELYGALKLAILDGQLSPNERMVEAEIARLASVSRTPVREAIRKLEADGLVRQTSVGVVVAEVSAGELRELCEVREVLEGMASRLAATARSEMDLQRFERLAVAHDEAIEAGDLPQIVSSNRAFHEAIWWTSGNDYLVDLLSGLRSRIASLQATSLADGERQRIGAEDHRGLLHALRERNADEAEELARRHFRESMAARLAQTQADTAVAAAT